MTAHPRLLRRVFDVRKRLRDAQAGAAGQAGAEAQLAHDEAAAAEEAGWAALDDGLLALARAQSALALFRLDDERQNWEARKVSLAERAAEADAAADAARAELRTRERALRGAERALESSRAERSHKESRDEQSAADDLSGARVALRKAV